jgi:integrase
MLTDKEIQNAKPKEKPYRLADGNGLYLEVTPIGSKLWRWKFRFEAKEKRLAIGVYPNVRAPEARKLMAGARIKLKSGIDPSAEKRAKRDQDKAAGDYTFEAVARTWFNKAHVSLAESTRTKNLRFFEQDVFPFIGKRPIANLAAPDLLAILRRIEGRGANDIARRVHNLCGRTFRYAVSHGLCARDPSRDIELGDILPSAKVQHHASVIDPKGAGELLRAIDGFTGAFTTRCALRLAPLVFVRPGELRHGEWTEFDFNKSEWRIPGNKMKMGEQHIVPLSRQAIEVLREIQQVTGSGQYVFPSERGGGRPMSENTVNAALRRLGYKSDEMTGHGFRSMASTLLHELGYPHQVIERQLAHGERNQVSAAYNFAEHLPERRKMMQQWADYLDKLKAGAEVIPLHGAAA